MPSGHAQAAFFGAVFWARYLAYRVRTRQSSQRFATIGTIILYTLATLIGYSRVQQHCHTTSQVVAGGLMGVLLASGTFNVFRHQKWLDV